MKRLTGVFLSLLLVLLFCGCGCQQEQSSQPTVPSGFESRASIRYGDMDLTALVSRTQEGVTTVTFESPESLKDLTLTLQGEEVTLSYQGLSLSLNANGFPARSIARVMQDALNRALEPQGCTVSLEDGVLELRGQIDAYEFVLRMDGENGNLLSLSVPGENMEMTFENFQIIPQFTAQENSSDSQTP